MIVKLLKLTDFSQNANIPPLRAVFLEDEMKGSINLFTLRVVVEKDSTYGYFAAYCLETGNVATADDKETALEMISEVLYDEIAYALKNRDFTNLFSRPAPAHVWARWKEVVERSTPTQKRLEVRTDGSRETAELVVGQEAA